MAEKDCAGAFCAADGRFFPQMSADKSNLRQEGGMTPPCFACGAVNAAASGADFAMG